MLDGEAGMSFSSDTTGPGALQPPILNNLRQEIVLHNEGHTINAGSVKLENYSSLLHI